MKNRTIANKILSIVLAVAMVMPLAAPNAYAATASHSLGTGAGGADYCTVWNYYYNQNTRVGPTINNHNLTYNGSTHDAFCMNPYLNNGTSYTSGSYSQGYGADLNSAIKYISMYNDGLPSGYTDQQRKMAVQIAIFDTSRMGVDYAPPNKANHWYIVMFNGGVYHQALNALWAAASSYTTPSTSASLGVPSNITNVHLTYNSNNDRFEATVNAGANAQYYNWSGYATRSGNNITFSVPAADVESWTGSYNGNKAYTSGAISGTGPWTRVISPTVWNCSGCQPLVTVDSNWVQPTNSVQYSLYVDGEDEGRPGGGGGLYGGKIAADSAIAGGGSGYVGSGTGVIGGSMMAGDTASLPPDNSNNGYARITLVN